VANLLTNEAKRNFQKDFLNRKLVIVGLAIGLLLVVTIIVLGSLQVSLFIRTSKITKVPSVTRNETKNAMRSSDLTLLIKKTEDQIKIANSYWSETPVSAMMAEILNLKPKDIKISGFAVERVEVGEKTKLSISGSAGGRVGLVNYVNLLRQDKFFSRVDLPVESLISDQGGRFIINLEK
jgi:hypothetical protein